MPFSNDKEGQIEPNILNDEDDISTSELPIFNFDENIDENFQNKAIKYLDEL